MLNWPTWTPVTVRMPGEQRPRRGVAVEATPRTVAVLLERSPCFRANHGRYATRPVYFDPSSITPLEGQEDTP